MCAFSLTCRSVLPFNHIHPTWPPAFQMSRIPIPPLKHNQRHYANPWKTSNSQQGHNHGLPSLFCTWNFFWKPAPCNQGGSDFDTILFSVPIEGVKAKENILVHLTAFFLCSSRSLIQLCAFWICANGLGLKSWSTLSDRDWLTGSPLSIVERIFGGFTVPMFYCMHSLWFSRSVSWQCKGDQSKLVVRVLNCLWLILLIQMHPITHNVSSTFNCRTHWLFSHYTRP